MNVKYPHNNLPQASDKIPSHFSSVEAYEKWRADIEPTIEKIKRDMYPSALGCNPLIEPSPKFSFFSVTSWFKWGGYHGSLFAPPILLEEDRQLLEYKLYRIKKYMDHVHPGIQECMAIDIALLQESFTLLEKARERLRAKFPDYPIEYKEKPIKAHIELALVYGIFVGISIPKLLLGLEKLTTFRISAIFNFVPLAIIPMFSNLAEISLTPIETLIFLSFCFYYAIIGAILRYKFPSLKIRYCSMAKSIYQLLFNLIPALCILVPTYLYPHIWAALFFKAPYNSVGILLFGVFGFISTGEFLGILAFKIKQWLGRIITMRTQQKHICKNSPLLFAALCVFLCSFPAFVLAEEAGSIVKAVPCKGLGPFKNVDELIYQFYINLDSDCLFKMPLPELEDIWDTKILSHKRATGYEYAKLRESDTFAKKPYQTERDAFYVEAYIYDDKTEEKSFYVKITDAYQEKYRALFTSDQLPSLLPPPLETSHQTTAIGVKCKNRLGYLCVYYWLNKEQNKMIEMDSFEDKSSGRLNFTSVSIYCPTRKMYSDEGKN